MRHNDDIIMNKQGGLFMPRVIPIQDLQDTAAISRMCNESLEPIYITKNAYARWLW